MPFRPALQDAFLSFFIAVIIQSPENGTVLFGDEFTLNCVAVFVHHGWWLVNQQAVYTFEDGCLTENTSVINETNCSLQLNLTVQSSCMELRQEISITCYFVHKAIEEVLGATAFVQVFGKHIHHSRRPLSFCVCATLVDSIMHSSDYTTDHQGC